MRRSPYNKKTGARTRNAVDSVYTGQGGAKAAIKLTLLQKGSVAKGYAGRIVLGVNPSATPGPATR